MVDIINPIRAEVFYNKSKLSLAEIKKRTGASHVLNGWVFNTKFSPCDYTTVAGEKITVGKYNDWCFTSDGQRCFMSANKGTPYLLSGVPILHEGNQLHRDLTPDVARPAERTAVGWRKDGSVVLAVYTDKLTREALTVRMQGLGCVDALMFDGGGSTSCDFPSGKITTSRKVATVLLFWTDNAKCPYPEPTKEIKMLSIGTGAKWVQWQLNRHGFPCVIDGIVGTNTVSKIKAFQTARNMEDVDGIVGRLTRKELLK